MTNKGLTSLCDAQCKKLQEGLCNRLTIDEIEILLDETDWEDLDKGELLTPYILKDENRESVEWISKNPSEIMDDIKNAMEDK